ncbi:hypothetical protein [Microbacterium sp. LWH12-1.2]|uniref:hypothetical protein n=1 Tax=Microbacterium sp. LWH12-1.2 TaxID=3135259 RepID=UPI00344639DE
MTTLAQLFPQGPRIEEASTTFDDHHTVRRLTEMFGDPSDDFDMTRPRASVQRLSQLVEEAVADAAPATIPAPPASAKRRRRRRFDGLAAAAASLAIVGVATAGIVGGVQMANASPADGVMQSLRADEAMIQNAEQAFMSAHDRLSAKAVAGEANAAALRTAVDGARTAPDPRSTDGAATIAILDAVLADGIIAEIDRHAAALQAVVLPEPVDPYVRNDIDEDSLSEVGVAIDDAQAQLAELDAATAELREGRTKVEDLDAQHATTLEGLAASFTALGIKAIEENPDAEAPLRDAVTAAAAHVVSSKLGGAEGAAAVTAYRDAVVALVTDQAITEEERAEAARRERQNRQQNQEPDPTPTEEPVVPNPEPTAPPVEGDPEIGDGLL